MVPGWTSSENVAVMVVLTVTLLAPEAGVRAVIVGAMMSAVMNDQDAWVMVLPARSCAPLRVTV